jgi:hypothetical protein
VQAEDELLLDLDSPVPPLFRQQSMGEALDGSNIGEVYSVLSLFNDV